MCSALSCMIIIEGVSRDPWPPSPPNPCSFTFTNPNLGEMSPSNHIQGCPSPPIPNVRAWGPPRKRPQDLGSWIVTSPMFLLNPMSNYFSSEVVFICQIIPFPTLFLPLFHVVKKVMITPPPRWLIISKYVWLGIEGFTLFLYFFPHNDHLWIYRTVTVN